MGIKQRSCFLTALAGSTLSYNAATWTPVRPRDIQALDTAITKRHRAVAKVPITEAGRLLSRFQCHEQGPVVRARELLASARLRYLQRLDSLGPVMLKQLIAMNAARPDSWHSQLLEDLRWLTRFSLDAKR
eukprot:6656467-Lingulodinium_polyedra.AAC.1